MHLFASLQRKPLKVLFGAVTLFVAAFCLFASISAIREERTRAADNLTHARSMLVQSTRASLANYSLAMQALGQGLWELGASFDPEKGRDLIERMARADSGIVGLGLARTDGQLLLVAGVPAGRALPNLLHLEAHRGTFLSALASARLQVGRPGFFPVIGQWAIPLRQPIVDIWGNVIAVMGVGLRIDGGNAAWARMALAPDVGAALVHPDGYFFHRNPLPPPASAEVLKSVYGQQAAAGVLAGLRRLAAPSGIAEIELDGENQLVAYERLDEHGIYALTMMPAGKVRQNSLKATAAPALWLLVYLLAGAVIYRYADRMQAQALREVGSVTASRQAIVEGANYAIIATDLAGTIRSFNAAAERMLGYAAAEVVHQMSAALFHEGVEVARRAGQLSAELGEKIRPGFDVLVARLRHGMPEEHEWTYIRKDGSHLPVLLSVSVVRDTDGVVQGYVGIASDISERRAAQAKLEFLAEHDPLTGLANRSLLHREFARRVTAYAGEEFSAALLLMDLDRFKEINDTLGHHIGDDVLKDVSARLMTVVDATIDGALGGLVSRLGGDEFVLLIVGAADRVHPVQLAERVQEALRQPFVVGGIGLEVGASIGIAIYPRDGADSHALLRSADVAMYAAKAAQVGIAVYSPQQDRHTPERLALMTDLGQALRNDELILHYQPKLDLASREIVGYEALVRWNHPRQGQLQPDAFIALAETGNLIHPLTLHVIELALAERRRWRDAGRSHTMAVNISARNLLDKGFAETIGKLVERYNVAAGELEFELTETALIQDPEGAAQLLDRIAALGIRLSIDDFGTGFSSLAYLRRLPLHALKIDRMFVQSLADNTQDLAIVRSTIGLAHNLGLKVIAEGVEDRRVLSLLADLGCDQAQGFYISKPLPADQLSTLPQRF